MDDYAKFPFVLACFWETIRLFPPVQMIPKVAAQDVSISVQTSNVMESPASGLPFTDTDLSNEAKSNSTASKSNLLTTDQSTGGQTTFVVKKGTIIFLNTPGVREYLCH